MSARGRFITLEGGEGAGKSVQARRLEARLRRAGVDVVRTREPGGSPHAEVLREAILSGFAQSLGAEGEALLFAAARIDHLERTILPALMNGQWVVSDRFADSTRAYQGAAGRLPQGFVERLERVTVGDNAPDLTLILDVAPEIGLERAAHRRAGGEADRFEREDPAFHKTLRRAFLAIAATEPKRCVVIEASKSEDEVADAIWAAVEARLQPGEVARAAAS